MSIHAYPLTHIKATRLLRKLRKHSPPGVTFRVVGRGDHRYIEERKTTPDGIPSHITVLHGREIARKRKPLPPGIAQPKRPPPRVLVEKAS